MKFRYRFWLIACILFCLSDELFAQLQAEFTFDKPGGCSPVAISFNNQTRGASANAIYQWDFGNGNLSSLFSGAAVYTEEQTYTVTLTVTDGGKTSTKSAQVTVYKSPTVDFSASVAKGCLPLPVTFNAKASAGSGFISNYTWDFGDGNTLSETSGSPQHVYSVVQTPPVSLTVTNQYGCHTTLQKSNLVNVLPGVHANISADKNFLCLISDPVQFTNTSDGPGTLSYLWDFGDGKSSTIKNPQYVFNKKGIYNVSLRVTSTEGCVVSTTLTNMLNVASFTTDFGIPSPLCINTGVVFANKSVPAPDVNSWIVDGNPYGYNPADLYTSFYTSGTHTITLNTTFGSCTQTTTKNIVVSDYPSPVGFTYAEQGKCGPPETLILTDISNATKHEWDLNYSNYQPNITSTASQPSLQMGTNVQQVFLRSTNAAGCSVSSSQQIYIPNPVVGISSDGNQSTCGTPNTQTFHSSGPTLSSWLWHFGDGTTSTEASPTHTYTNVGTYTAYLTYKTQDGCTGTTSNYMTFYVSPPLKIDFTATPTQLCGTSMVQFAASANDPNVLFYNWGFGDGSWDYHALHYYDVPGTYSVTLTASSPGCTATITKTDYITVAPFSFSLFSSTNVCTGDRGDVSFNFKATGANRLNWNFGDGTQITTAGDLTSYQHHYVKDGFFTVTVTAENDPNHCQVTRDLPVSVFHKQSPKLTADKVSVCTSDMLNVRADYVNKVNGANFYGYFGVRFEYGDGTPYQGSVNPWQSFWSDHYEGQLQSFEKGKKDIRMITTTSGFNCNDTSNFIPLQIRGVKADFQIVQSNGCLETPVILKDNSTVDPGNSILTWSWDFNDGTILKKGGTVSHTYQQPGNYPVRLTVTDAAGCSATSGNEATAYVSVFGPKASFSTSGNDVPLNTTVYFYNSTNTYGSANTNYLWEFGDGSTSSDYFPSHTYPVAGSYTIKLSSWDAVTGCRSGTSQTIRVSVFNSAFAFSKTNVAGSCPPVLVRFNNTSVNFSRVQWDFGDGFTADNLNQVSHVYQKPGKYIVTLTVSAPNNLEEKYIDSVFVNLPSGSFTAKPLEGCIGAAIFDSAVAVNANTYLWDFGDGTIASTTVSSASHIYQQSGLYKPKLLVQDINGCLQATAMNDEINIHPKPEVIIHPADAVLCQGSALQLQAEGGSTYQWTPNTGLSNAAIASPIATPAATTIYRLDIADELGCKNNTNVTVTVVNPGNLQTGNDTAVCEGESVRLHVTGQTNYSWTGNTNGLDRTDISNPLASPVTTTTYTVTGTDSYNCFPQTANITIRVLSLPMVNAGTDTTIQAGASFMLTGSGSSDVVRWNWTPAKYLSCTDCPQPVSRPRETMHYTLTVTNADGCVTTDQVNVKMECDENRVSIPNAFTPNRDRVNDLFTIRGISYVKHLVIYDRWGAKVFERKNFDPADPASCWDGNQNGMPVVTGTYVYFVEMDCPSGGAFSRKGTVTLIR